MSQSQKSDQIEMSNSIHLPLEYTYRKLPDHFYFDSLPAKIPKPELIILNEPLAKQFSLDPSKLRSVDGVNLLSGSVIPENMKPFAQAYAGHQYGHFTMLGDGRAMLMGELMDLTHKRFDLQWKGSGRTPFSRGGDGKAVLGPMLREYIISEALYHLGIPTTRSLAVLTTGEQVQRDTLLPGSILVRVASSHIRVGTFSYAATFGNKDDVKALADYAIQRHYPHLQSQQNRYLALIREVIERQAKLISQWMLVGFVHGVMNTDNMTISGESIDFGPCAFMDYYDPLTVFSSIDRYGRYAYGNQPKMAQWNLARFAETLLDLIHEDKQESFVLAQYEVERFMPLYQAHYMKGMCSKLGLVSQEDTVNEEDAKLINDLLSWMHHYQADYTNTFHALSQTCLPRYDYFASEEVQAWWKRWEARKQMQPLTRVESIVLMKQSNPRVIPRNHLVEEALAMAQVHNFSPLHLLLDVLKKPFNDRNDDVYTTLSSSAKQPYTTYCGT